MPRALGFPLSEGVRQDGAGFWCEATGNWLCMIGDKESSLIGRPRYSGNVHVCLEGLEHIDGVCSRAWKSVCRSFDRCGGGLCEIVSKGSVFC